MTKKTISLFVAGACALLLSACGFKPLYATADQGGTAGLRNVELEMITASQTITPILQRAFERRTAGDGEPTAYALIVDVDEVAERLAVQSDASVTRYNYRLVGEYRLIDQVSGKVINGEVQAIASFNVVSSQYSTLFGETAAQEKAATLLVEEIERDILLHLADGKK